MTHHDDEQFQRPRFADFDALAKRLLACPRVLEALAHAACPGLPHILDFPQAVQFKELPTVHFQHFVPDALFQVPTRAHALGSHLLPDHLLARPSVVLVEATSRPGDHLLDQTRKYLAQAELAFREAGRAPGLAYVLVFCLGPATSPALGFVARWHQAKPPPVGLASMPELLVVESSRLEHSERAWEVSAVLGFAMEASVAVKRGRAAAEELMERGGDRLMVARNEHRQAGEERCLSAVETVLQFLVRMEARGTEEARLWGRRVAGWWQELGRRHGADEEEIMREARTVYEYLIQDGLEQGMQKGLEEGLQKGLEEGLQKGAATLREAIFDVLGERFGRVPEGVRAHVEGISDLERLRRLVRQAVVVARPEDLLNGAG